MKITRDNLEQSFINISNLLSDRLSDVMIRVRRVGRLPDVTESEEIQQNAMEIAGYCQDQLTEGSNSMD